MGIVSAVAASVLALVSSVKFYASSRYLVFFSLPEEFSEVFSEKLLLLSAVWGILLLESVFPRGFDPTTANILADGETLFVILNKLFFTFFKVRRDITFADYKIYIVECTERVKAGDGNLFRVEHQHAVI